MNAAGEELAPAALAIARVEYPSLDAPRYLDRLAQLGAQAAARLRGGAARSNRDAVRTLNEFLYDELGFSGNRHRYDDPRNSFLNEVLERRTGIPISLAVVYLEIARLAGVRVAGVNFPGHFLLRAGVAGDAAHPPTLESADVIIDPFHGGAQLSEADCRELLRQHVGDEAAYDVRLLEPATRHDIIVRMLVNLKRLYVRMRSYPHARFISDLLVAVDPSAVAELRDRGLLSYQMEDFASALRDLESYLRLVPRRTVAPEGGEDEEGTRGGAPDAEIWEHVKMLRKRVASLN